MVRYIDQGDTDLSNLSLTPLISLTPDPPIASLKHTTKTTFNSLFVRACSIFIGFVLVILSDQLTNNYESGSAPLSNLKKLHVNCDT